MVTDLETFFSSASDAQTDGCVFRRENVQVAKDGPRQYTFLLPCRKDIKAEMLDEYFIQETGSIGH